MAVTIEKVRVITTAPEGINLLVVRVETNQPGLFGLGCATFAYRHLTVKAIVEEYLDPLLKGCNAENIVFLASDASNYVNGVIIPVDGGYLVK